MAVAIPVIAAFASAGTAVAAAGGFAAAMGTVTGFLSIAGAALTTVGAITGKKDLLKIGGLMSLGGGIGQAFGALSSGTAAAGEAASQGAQEAFRASELAGTGATNAAMEAASSGGSLMESARAATSAAQNLPKQAITDFGAEVAGATPTQAMPSATTPTIAQPTMVEPTTYGSQPSPQEAFRTSELTGQATHANEVARGASTMNQSELLGLLKAGAEKTGKSLSGVADFLTKNKELVKIGGDALGGMYGPQAEQMDFQKSIYERRMANLKSPVKLYYGGA